jgi:hypothetical protein
MVVFCFEQNEHLILETIGKRVLAGTGKTKLLVGKRCSPILIYIALAVIIVSLSFLALRRSRNLPPQAVPMHRAH